MRKARLLVTLSLLELMAVYAPACAWERVDAGPFSFLFHRYGDDMYQPPITPDRPYWHGDAAVPPDLRWHDREIEVVDEYGFPVATRVPQPEGVAVAGAAVDLPPPPVRLRRRQSHPHPRAKIVRRDCLPAATPLELAPAPPPPDLPPVPAPTEH